MKQGDIVFCKKTKATVWGFPIHQVDFYYIVKKVTYYNSGDIDIEIFVEGEKIINHYFTYSIGPMTYYRKKTYDLFSDYFLTINEIRCLKLKKLENENR